MSLIALAAPLIRLAATDDGYAQDLYETVTGDHDAWAGLVNGHISEDELDLLTPAEWQWYATWRQSLDGGLDPVLLDHLVVTATTRFARFSYRSLVLQDPATNDLAPRFDTGLELTLQVDRIPSAADEAGDPVLGLQWLDTQARGVRVMGGAGPVTLRISAATEDDRSGQGQVRYEVDPTGEDVVDLDWLGDEVRVEQLPRELFAEMNSARVDEKVELTIDALQCGTPASDFLLRCLTSAPTEPISPWVSRLGGRHVGLVIAQLDAFDDDGTDAVREQLDAFAEARGLNPQWYLRDQPLRDS
jgi:hypothetical protein